METHECPVSLISAESKALVPIISHMQRKSLKAVPFGADLMKWPAKFFDAWLVIDAAQIEIRNACIDAQRPK